MYPSGRYIKNKFICCHKPSFATIDLENSGLSAMINSTKNRKASIKEITDIIPVIPSLALNESMAKISGTSKNKMNPITEPAPCIFEAAVTTSFVSLTLKKQVNIHAPTANTIIKIADTMISVFDT